MISGPIWGSGWLVVVVDKEHTDDPLSILESTYTVTKDWDAKSYCGLTLQRDYLNRTVDISVLSNVEHALQCTANSL